MNRHGRCKDYWNLRAGCYHCAVLVLGRPRLWTHEKVAPRSVADWETHKRPQHLVARGRRLTLRLFGTRRARRAFRQRPLPDGSVGQGDVVVDAGLGVDGAFIHKVDHLANRAVHKSRIHIFDQHDLRTLLEVDKA